MESDADEIIRTECRLRTLRKASSIVIVGEGVNPAIFLNPLTFLASSNFGLFAIQVKSWDAPEKFRDQPANIYIFV